MRLVPLAFIAVLTTFAHTAAAEDAEALFHQGVSLLREGHVGEACAAFERSQALEASAGTLLNLGGCYERAERFPEAYDAFVGAREAARARGRADWERQASEHLAGLASRVALLTIDATQAGGQDTKVEIDGRVLSRAQLQGPVAVSPGAHIVRASVPGGRTFAQAVTVPPDSAVAIPLLLAPPSPVPTKEPRAEPPPPVGPVWRAPTGVAATGVGVLGLALGIVATLAAASALDEAKTACPSYPDHCRPEASGPNDRAGTWSRVATAGFVGGAAFTAAGLVLLLWPSARSPAILSVRPAAQNGRVVLDW